MTAPNEIDILAIQEEAERVAREEYMDAHRRLEERAEVIRGRELKWNNILTAIKMNPRVAPNGVVVGEESLDDVLAQIKHDVLEYHKLEKMFKLINGNPLLKTQWDRLVMSIRLVGGDSNDQAD